MKKVLFLSLGLGMFLLVGVSVANAQFAVGSRVEVVPGAYNLNIRPTPSTYQTALGSVNAGAWGTVTDGPVAGQGYSWSKVRWDSAPEGWSVNTPWLRVTSLPQSGCGDVNRDGTPNIVDVNLVVNVAFRDASSSYVTDVNGSGATDMIDVAEEVDYVFRGMAEPTGCTQPNQPPEIQYFTGPTSLVEDTYGTWNALASDLNGDRLTYIIDWGDNYSASTTVISNATSGYPISAQHVYPTPGTYPITLTVQDPSFAADYASTSVVINPTSTVNQAPIMNSFTGPSSLYVGQVGTWYANATDPEGSYLNYWFDLGNASRTASGASGQTVSVTNSYSLSGNYSIGAYAIDEQGAYSNFKWLNLTVSASTTGQQSPVLTPTYGQTDPYAVTPSTITYQCGDLDKSGAVNTIDVQLMYSYWVGGVAIPAGVNADVNGDGIAANISDYSVLYNYALKGGPAPTCGITSGGSGGGSKINLSPSASVYDTLQQQINLIYQQLQFLKGQL